VGGRETPRKEVVVSTKKSAVDLALNEAAAGFKSAVAARAGISGIPAGTSAQAWWSGAIFVFDAVQSSRFPQTMVKNLTAHWGMEVDTPKRAGALSALADLTAPFADGEAFEVI
jgi:hypothetical protein